MSDITERCMTCDADITSRFGNSYSICTACETTMGYGDFERGQVVVVSDEFYPDEESSIAPGMKGLIVARYPSGAFGVAMQPEGYEHPVPMALYAHEIQAAES